SLADDTLVVFTSDHGTQVGAHGINAWQKKRPYEESVAVPMIVRLPGVLDGGVRREVLTSPVDLLPTLCGLCDVPVPRTVEGHDLSNAWRGLSGAFEQDAVLMMNFGSAYDYLVDGLEWRALRTKEFAYVRWLDGREELFDLRRDPLEMSNLIDDPDHQDLKTRLIDRMAELMAGVGDELLPAHAYGDWYDAQRRIVRNARGPLGDPEADPDWSLLG
ncbi:hypothetical protein LCGC14_2126510, partial [marine sediment metagenome]